MFSQQTLYFNPWEMGRTTNDDFGVAARRQAPEAQCPQRADVDLVGSRRKERRPCGNSAAQTFCAAGSASLQILAQIGHMRRFGRLRRLARDLGVAHRTVYFSQFGADYPGIAFISALMPTRAIMRLILQTSTFSAISVRTPRSRRDRKWQGPVQDLIVPNGCSTVERRTLIGAAGLRRRAFEASTKCSCSHLETRRSYPVVQRLLRVQSLHAFVQ